MSATAQTTVASSHADAEESLRAATQWLQQSGDSTPIPPFLQQRQQPPTGNHAQSPPAQNQDDSPTGFRKLQTVPTPPMPLDVQMGGAGFTPGAQQQPAQQPAGGITMMAEDIAVLTSKPEVPPQGAESAETPLLAPDAPSSTSQAAIDPVKVLTDGTTAPLSSEETSARVPLPSALKNMSGTAGATTTSDYIGDVVDWKVGAASLAVAIVLWFIFA